MVDGVETKELGTVRFYGLQSGRRRAENQDASEIVNLVQQNPGISQSRLLLLCRQELRIGQNRGRRLVKSLVVQQKLLELPGPKNSWLYRAA
jgi:hypothetical protein